MERGGWLELQAARNKSVTLRMVSRRWSSRSRTIGWKEMPIICTKKGMEQEWRLSLVDRTGKLLEFTEAGTLFYKYALNTSKLLEESQLR